MLAITGSTGFIGRSIVDHLPFPQRRLITKHSTSKIAGAEFIVGNLQNTEDILKLVKNADTLIHLASQSNPRNSNEKIKDSFHDDFIHHLHLLETYCKLNPKGHIIFSSTGGNMYDPGSPFQPRTEQDLPKPSSSYSIQKLALENYLRLFSSMYGTSVTILRISNPYGTLLPTERAHGLIGIAFNKLLKNEPIQIIDSPNSVRDYLHLDDLARAFQLAIQKKPQAEQFRVINIGSGKGSTINEVLDIIERVTQLKFDREIHSKSKSAPTWSVLSNEYARHHLGWLPTVSLESGISNMWQNIKQQSL